MKTPRSDHDLDLPAWGPYSKKYYGISHIPGAAGKRFDLAVFPGFYRRKTDVASVLWECGVHPWESAADFGYYSYRHEIEWKDRVYCDISYSRIDDSAYLIRAKCVNATDTAQNIALHLMASMNEPDTTANGNALIKAKVILPPGAQWIDALDRSSLTFSRPRPGDDLVYDGWLRGETVRNDFVGGRGIGKDFGRDKGDRIVFNIRLPQRVDNAVLMVRYAIKDGASTAFSIEGLGDNKAVQLSGTGSISLARVALGSISGDHAVTMTSQGGAPVELDGFVIVSEKDELSVDFTIQEIDPKAAIEQLSNESILLKYDDCDRYYGIAWRYEHSVVRELLTDELDTFLRFKTHDHVSSVLAGNGRGHFTNVFLRPIPMAPRSDRILYAVICSGAHADVAARLSSPLPDEKECEAIFARAQKTAVTFAETTAERYRFSQERMAAVTLTNIVYPVYTKRSYIRHHTPGRWWDSLYTWDSGFIGLGLLEIDIERAIDNLNAYLTPEDDESAFIHHGSPVPVQFYLFHELWNRTQDKALLAYFYPRLKRYHAFLAGRLGSSTTKRLSSGLLSTWDYFYNSGGWDDYPPQMQVHDTHSEKSVAPMVNTSHAIRTAKILSMAAASLGQNDDIPSYEDDIRSFTDAVQKYAWDEAEGYFGYVTHDDNGRPTGILRHASGANFNRGLDGLYPLIAGITTGEQEERIVGHLFNEKELLTEAGISTVDQSAPYFTPDGYWNGAVWMPHQWFFWKAMLGLGLHDRAFQIASTALALWEHEVGESYNCFEHFIIESRRGAGWHQFSGLSTPVLSWFAAYYLPGRFTVPFDVWITEKRFSADNTRFDASVIVAGTHNAGMIVTMGTSHDYSLTIDGRAAEYHERSPGIVEFLCPPGMHTVEIKKR